MPKFSLWLSASLLLAITTNVSAEPPPPNKIIDPAQVAAPSVQSLLSKMSQNATRFNYRGAFTYQNQTSIALQSFRIEHWIENGLEHDRIKFLNGPDREIVRDGRSIDCKAMGDQLLQGNFASLGKALAGLDDLYQFEIRSQERIAGRTARVLQVIPKDPYRFGYFLSIDEETGLVLKSWLIDENARPLERYQFVTLELNPDISQLHSSTSAHQHRAIADVTPCNPVELSKPDIWQIAWVPQGFVFAGQRKLPNGQTMLMYTDGLTTFSIFIEPTVNLFPEGVGQRGATLAYMSRLSVNGINYRVSVVGEIPVAAAAKIAQNIAGAQ